MFFIFNKKNKLKKNLGFSLFETLIYVSSAILILFIIINTITLMSKSYSDIKMSKDISNSVISIMGRISKEIRWSESVNYANSIFNSDSGLLVLNSLNDSGVSVDKRFYVENDILKLKEGFEDAKALNTGNIKVKRFFINSVNNGVSELVKFEIEIEESYGNKTKSETFYNSIVMRESY